MAKEKDIKSFVEKIDDMKKLNPKDLSSDQDLSIAIMNLISIEEHLIFSGAKTEKTSYYDLVAEIREMRKDLLLKIIKTYEGEVWCISKHLLSASMRLMEVGCKQQSLGNTKDAYDLFDKAYELYCLFWGLNVGAIGGEQVAWAKEIGTNVEDIRKYVDNVKGKVAPSVAANVSAPSKVGNVVAPAAGGGMMAKLKEGIKKAVNCCIE